MPNHLRILALAAAGVAATMQAASAVPFALDVLAGEPSAPIGTGVIEVEEVALRRGGQAAPDEFAFEIMLFDQLFTEEDDILGSPFLELAAGRPMAIGFGVAEDDPFNPVEIEQEGIAEIILFGDLAEGEDGALSIEASVVPADPALPEVPEAPVPLPAGLPLLLAGLGALAAQRRLP